MENVLETIESEIAYFTIPNLSSYISMIWLLWYIIYNKYNGHGNYVY